ncbi:unnamed protein product [Caenorhabditis bovis]|uniref:G-protein coupled receptors family 1 profile domain-containing protein n=1 Tax=Caenorhabditis bovis TaxID=2654633 RepID=A0A8S1EAV2_9PELO|nr:unnamed protein product [Caenorhabditis bovis]
MRLTGWPEYMAMAYLPVILIGLTGNILSLHVYTSPKMRKSTVAFLLCSLSISDIFVLLFALPLYSIFHLPVWDDPYASFSTRRMLISFSTKYLYPLCMMAKTASLYIMVLITIERWIAVCRPLQVLLKKLQKKTMTSGNTINIFFWVHILCTFHNSVKAVIAIIIFSVVLNLPKFFEYDVGHSERNGYYLQPGRLYPDNHWWYFMVYFIIISVLFDYLLPFVIMFIANHKVIDELRKTRKERSLLTTTQQKDQNTTVMLLVVTILFAFCHFFAMALKIAESIFGGFLTAQHEYFEIIGDVFNLLIVVHIATTFFIYYVFSSRFRNVLLNRQKTPVDSSFTDINKRRLIQKFEQNCKRSN